MIGPYHEGAGLGLQTEPSSKGSCSPQLEALFYVEIVAPLDGEKRSGRLTARRLLLGGALQ